MYNLLNHQNMEEKSKILLTLFFCISPVRYSESGASGLSIISDSGTALVKIRHPDSIFFFFRFFLVFFFFLRLFSLFNELPLK